MLNNYQELSSETETTVRLDIYEQNETNFVFLHAVLTEILKAEKKILLDRLFRVFRHTAKVVHFKTFIL